MLFFVQNLTRFLNLCKSEVIFFLPQKTTKEKSLWDDEDENSQNNEKNEIKVIILRIVLTISYIYFEFFRKLL